MAPLDPSTRVQAGSGNPPLRKPKKLALSRDSQAILSRAASQDGTWTRIGVAISDATGNGPQSTAQIHAEGLAAMISQRDAFISQKNGIDARIRNLYNNGYDTTESITTPDGVPVTSTIHIKGNAELRTEYDKLVTRNDQLVDSITSQMNAIKAAGVEVGIWDQQKELKPEELQAIKDLAAKKGWTNIEKMITRVGIDSNKLQDVMGQIGTEAKKDKNGKWQHGTGILGQMGSNLGDIEALRRQKAILEGKISDANTTIERVKHGRFGAGQPLTPAKPAAAAAAASAPAAAPPAKPAAASAPAAAPPAKPAAASAPAAAPPAKPAAASAPAAAPPAKPAAASAPAAAPPAKPAAASAPAAAPPAKPAAGPGPQRPKLSESYSEIPPLAIAPGDPKAQQKKEINDLIKAYTTARSSNQGGVRTLAGLKQRIDSMTAKLNEPAAPAAASGSSDRGSVQKAYDGVYNWFFGASQPAKPAPAVKPTAAPPAKPAAKPVKPGSQPGVEKSVAGAGTDYRSRLSQALQLPKVSMPKFETPKIQIPKFDFSGMINRLPKISFGGQPASAPKKPGTAKQITTAFKHAQVLAAAAKKATNEIEEIYAIGSTPRRPFLKVGTDLEDGGKLKPSAVKKLTYFLNVNDNQDNSADALNKLMLDAYKKRAQEIAEYNEKYGITT